MEGGVDQGEGGGSEMMRERERPEQCRKKGKKGPSEVFCFFMQDMGRRFWQMWARFNILSKIMFPIPQIHQDYLNSFCYMK